MNSLTIGVMVFSAFYLLAIFILFQITGEYFSQSSKGIIALGGPVLAFLVDFLTYQDCKE